MTKLIHTAKHILLPKITLFFILSLGFVRFSLAQDSGKLENPIKYKTIGEIMQAGTELIAVIAIPVVGLFIAYSGFLFVTARGNEVQLSKARQTFLWSVVGAVVVFGAYAVAVALNEFAQSLR